MENSVDLEVAGLTRGESKVYLSLLALGKTTTGPLVERSGISRSIIYNILERLIEKGLASYVQLEKTRYYQAANPDRLVDYIDDKTEELKKNRQVIKEMLPSLNMISEGTQQNNVTVFEGFKGMISAHENLYKVLKKGDDYYFFGIPATQPKHFHSYWQKDHLRRVEAGITCRLLFHPSTDPEVLRNRNSYEGCDARYMPTSVDSPTWIMGYKDVVIIGMASASPITIEIVNEEIAQSFRNYFESFWKNSKLIS